MVLRLAGAFFAVVDLAAVERLAVEVARLAVARLAGVRDAAACGRAGASSLHLPDITRCAASATASAISEPSLVALDIMLLAAFEAVSAASMPASRIALRALGLAAIAAAAAVSPAASISLLIAALASLSTVLLPARLPPLDDALEEVDREDDFFADFAMFYSLSRDKRHFSAVTVPWLGGMRGHLHMLKGTAAAIAAMPFDMVSGRRCWPFVSF